MAKGNFNATIFDHISADAFLSANLILYVLVFSKRSRLSVDSFCGGKVRWSVLGIIISE